MSNTLTRSESVVQSQNGQSLLYQLLGNNEVKIPPQQSRQKAVQRPPKSARASLKLASCLRKTSKHCNLGTPPVQFTTGNKKRVRFIDEDNPVSAVHVVARYIEDIGCAFTFAVAAPGREQGRLNKDCSSTKDATTPHSTQSSKQNVAQPKTVVTCPSVTGTEQQTPTSLRKERTWPRLRLLQLPFKDGRPSNGAKSRLLERARQSRTKEAVNHHAKRYEPRSRHHSSPEPAQQEQPVSTNASEQRDKQCIVPLPPQEMPIITADTQEDWFRQPLSSAETSAASLSAIDDMNAAFMNQVQIDQPCPTEGREYEAENVVVLHEGRWRETSPIGQPMEGQDIMMKDAIPLDNEVDQGPSKRRRIEERRERRYRQDPFSRVLQPIRRPLPGMHHVQQNRQQPQQPAPKKINLIRPTLLSAIKKPQKNPTSWE